MRRLLAVVVAIAGALGVLAASGQAADSCSIYWTGATSSDWSTTSNWSLTDGGPNAGRLPGASDLVCMSTAPTTSAITLSSGSVEVGGIEWGGTSPVRPELTVGGTLQVDTLAGGSGMSAIYELSDTGTVVAKGSLATTSLILEGELDGPGTVKVGASGALRLGGGSAAPELAAGADLVSSATGIQLSSHGMLEMSGASTFENAGSLTLADGQGISDQDSAHPSRFINDAAGAVGDDGSSADGVTIGPAVTNDGTFSLTAGTLSATVDNVGTLGVTKGALAAGGSSGVSTDSGKFSVAASATLDLGGAWTMAVGATTTPASTGAVGIFGTLTADGSNTMPTLSVAGTLIAKGSVSVSGAVSLGELDGPGTVTASGGVSSCGTLKAAAHLVSEGSTEADSCSLYGGSILETTGSVDVEELDMYGASKLENSGSLQVEGYKCLCGDGITDQDPTHASEVVNEAGGTVFPTDGDATIDADVDNAGTLEVVTEAGLTISGPGVSTFTGTLAVRPNSGLDLDGSWTLAKGTTVTNPDGGYVTFASLKAPGNNTISGVTADLIASGTVTLEGNAEVSLQGGMGTIPSGQSAGVGPLSAGADLVNHGTAGVGGDLSGGSTVENAGSMFVSLTDTDLGDPSEVINDTGATLSGGEASTAVINHGTISIPSGAPTGRFGGSGFSSTDDGSLTAAAGTRLDLAGSWALASGASTASSSAGALQVAGTTTAAGSNTLNRLDVTGTLVADGAVKAPLLVLEGELDGPGTTTVPSGGSLRLGGTALPVMKAAADLVNDGTGSQVASKGTLDMYGASKFENAGTLALADGQGIFDLDSGHPSLVLNDATGTLSYAGSSSSAKVSVTPSFTNDGTVVATGGTLSLPGLTNLSGVGVLTGNVYRAFGGTLALPGNVTSNEANVGLGTTGSFSGTSANALASLRSNSGALTVRQTLALAGGLTNTGTATVYALLSAPSFAQSSGTLSIPISGTGAAGTAYGQLSVSRTAVLGGTLSISTASGFTPPLGSKYTIVKAGTVKGAFSKVNGAALSDRRYVVSYTSTSVVLTVLSDAPGVTGVSPDAGSRAGGGSVSITGSNFTSASKVRFGSAAAASVTFVSATQLRARPAAHAGGSVHVTVQTTKGTSSVSSADLYAFGVPAVSSVSPASGPVKGGTSVTVKGSGFVPSATVSFGATAAASVKFLSAAGLMVVAPGRAVGAVHVTVKTAAGRSAGSPADLFTYK